MSDLPPWKPKPVSRSKRAGITVHSPNPLQARPDCAAKIAEIISAFAAGERYMVEMMAYLIEAEEWVAAELFQEVRNLGTRMKILRSTMSKKVGHVAAEKAYKSILVPFREMQKDRNDLAHGFFLIRSDFPDALVRLDGWGNGRELWLYDLAVLQSCADEMTKRSTAVQQLLLQLNAAASSRYFVPVNVSTNDTKDPAKK